MERYANKRAVIRKHGRYARLTTADVGIGVCPKCNHLTMCHYYGDPREPFPDPRKFGQRCFTCEPLTDAEKQLQAEIEASKPKPPTFMDLLNKVAEAT